MLPNVIHYWDVFRRAKWSILVWTLTFALVGLGAAATTTNVYEATVVVTTNHLKGRSVGTGGTSRRLLRALGNQLGTAGLVEGIVGSPDSVAAREAFIVLRSRDFLTRFLEKHQPDPDASDPDEARDIPVFQSTVENEFDPDASDPDEARGIPVFQSTAWKLWGIYDEFRGSLSAKVGELMRKLYKPTRFDREIRRDSPTTGNPEAYRKIKRALAIERKLRQGVIHLKIRWRDPVTAAEWANGLVAELNSTLRETAITESRQRIAYLNRELEKTSVIPLRQSIYRLIEGEIHTIMIAETRLDYAFKVIDHAVPPHPDSPIRPRRSRMIWTTALMGFCIGAFWAFWRDSIRMLRGLVERSRAAR